VPGIDGNLTLSGMDAAAAAALLKASIVVGLHTDDWQHFSESRESFDAAFAGTGLLIETPRGERVELVG